jgi:hypothetical protein
VRCADGPDEGMPRDWSVLGELPQADSSPVLCATTFCTIVTSTRHVGRGLRGLGGSEQDGLC